MPDVTKMLSGATIQAAPRARAAWRRIQDKPSSIIVKRGSTALAAQTVRVEHNSTQTEVAGDAGNASRMTVTIFGVKSHPEVADTDLKRGDRFALNGQQYEIKQVVPTLGELQALGEAMA